MPCRTCLRGANRAGRRRWTGAEIQRPKRLPVVRLAETPDERFNEIVSRLEGAGKPGARRYASHKNSMSLALTRGESLALIVHSSSGRFFVAREYLMIASSILMLKRPFSSAGENFSTSWAALSAGAGAEEAFAPARTFDEKAPEPSSARKMLERRRQRAAVMRKMKNADRGEDFFFIDVSVSSAKPIAVRGG